MASRHSGPLRAFRIADMRHTIFDGSGALLHGARWNSPGRLVIYAAETYAGAMLEILVHASGSVPRSQGYVQIEIPAGMPVEEITPDDLPHWDSPSFDTARAFGDGWRWRGSLCGRRTADSDGAGSRLRRLGWLRDNV